MIKIRKRSDLINFIYQIAKEKKITVCQIEKNIGFGTGAIGKWKKSSPSLDSIIKLLNLFDKDLCIIDRIDDETTEVKFRTVDEKISADLQSIKENLSDEDKEKIHRILQAFL